MVVVNLGKFPHPLTQIIFQLTSLSPKKYNVGISAIGNKVWPHIIKKGIDIFWNEFELLGDPPLAHGHGLDTGDKKLYIQREGERVELMSNIWGLFLDLSPNTLTQLFSCFLFFILLLRWLQLVNSSKHPSPSLSLSFSTHTHTHTNTYNYNPVCSLWVLS
ncbi:hypothetical protein L1887_03137 [Cichorium endivia]|nr:hypothetical protein L1887_03137 [Cichorium endivia]